MALRRTCRPLAFLVSTTAKVSGLQCGTPRERTSMLSEMTASSGESKFPLDGGLQLATFPDIGSPESQRVPVNQFCGPRTRGIQRSEEHTSELQSRLHLVCRLLLEKKKVQKYTARAHRAQLCLCHDAALPTFAYVC